jgi:hypothetical protein
MNAPPKLHRHAQLGFGIAIVSQVVALVAQLLDQNWVAAVATCSAIVGWLIASQMERAVSALIGVTDALLLAPPQEGYTVAIVRTQHPKQFLLVNERAGTRWRISERGMWTREDW